MQKIINVVNRVIYYFNKQIDIIQRPILNKIDKLEYEKKLRDLEYQKKIQKIINECNNVMNKQEEAVEKLLNEFKKDEKAWRYLLEEIVFEFGLYRQDEGLRKTWDEKEAIYPSLEFFLDLTDATYSLEECLEMDMKLQEYLGMQCNVSYITNSLKKELLNPIKLQEILDEYNRS